MKLSDEEISFLEAIKIFWNYEKVFILKCILFLIVWVFIFVVAFGFTFATSGSMEPTIMVHDITVVSKLSYISRQPQRGDVIAFKKNKTMYGKRIIGIAGDKIEFHDGYTYINGELYDESAYLGEDVETNCLATFEVPERCVFVMGDNRENSKDSRMWDDPYVKISDIKGKHILIFPMHNIYKLRNLLEFGSR
jgi:signal peptidase I